MYQTVNFIENSIVPVIYMSITDLKTVLIAVGASAGGIILLLAVAIFGVCR